FFLLVFECVRGVMFDCLIRFFFQAEDGIRDRNVTGVQTCALPILRDVEGATLLRELRTEVSSLRRREAELSSRYGDRHPEMVNKIGRASCRERGEIAVDDGGVKKGIKTQTESKNGNQNIQGDEVSK